MRTHSASTPSSAALLPLVLLSLISFSLAFPTLRTRSNAPAAASFEPLFLRAAPQVGPTRSLERLRQRAAKRAPLAESEEEEKILVARSVAIAPRTVLKNPKRSLMEAVLKKREEAGVLLNPKKRAVEATAPVAVARRALERAEIEERQFAPSSVAAAGVYTVSVDDTYFSATPTITYDFATTAATAGTTTDAGDGGVFSASSGAPVKVVGSRTPLTRLTSSSGRTPTANVASSTAFTTTTTTSQTTTTTFLTATTTTTVPAGVVLSTSTVTSKATTSTAKLTTTSSKTTTTSAAAATKTGSWPSGNYIAAAYYPDWDGDLLPPSAVDMSLFDILDFAFAVPTSTFGLEWTQDNSGTLLTELVKYAHGNNTKVILTIGGWTDSEYFSLAVNSATHRATFVNNIATYVKTYNVDGVDIDWEYPGTSGADGNAESSADAANFLLFLQLLRSTLGTTKRISAAVTQTAFVGADGSPLADVSAFAAVLDNILVMNYDVWGSSSSPGPNAPLSNACSGSAQPGANEASAITAWTGAGMPASKIFMGVPSYGYISASTKTTLVHKRWSNGKRAYSGTTAEMSNRERAATMYANSKKSHMRRWFEEGQVKRAARDDARRAIRRAQRTKIDENALTKKDTIIVCPNNHSGLPCPGVEGQNISSINWNPLNGTTSSSNGTTTGDGVFTPGVGIGKLGNGDLAAIDGNQIQFYQLLSYGVLVQSGTSTTYTGVNGYTRAWDSCSNTPYLYDVARKVVITYDDPQSLTLKGQLAASKNIAGIAMWDISGDTDSWALTTAWRTGLGLS